MTQFDKRKVEFLFGFIWFYLVLIQKVIFSNVKFLNIDIFFVKIQKKQFFISLLIDL